MVEKPQREQDDSRPVYSIKHYAEKRPTIPVAPPHTQAVNSVRERARQRRVSGRQTSGDWAWVIIAAVLFTMVLVVSVGAFFFVQTTTPEIDIFPTADVVAALPTAMRPAQRQYDAGLLSERLILDDGTQIELTPWDGTSRFTVVVVGLDRRPEEYGIAYRTDTMMLVSIDPQTNRIGILSLPRDMYVNVPGYSALQRINTALPLGETQRLGYGPALMMQTVQLNLGIPVNDYLAVDFQAFIDLVDALGGVEIETNSVINDPYYPDMNYGYDPFYLPAGRHYLDGYDALRFARTRHGDSDIARARRQQQMMFAVRDRLFDVNMLPAMVARAPALWSSWQDNVYTGLTLEQVMQLGLFVQAIPAENITTGVIDYQYLQEYTTTSGVQVLVPDRARLGNLMNDVFGVTYNQQ